MRTGREHLQRRRSEAEIVAITRCKDELYLTYPELRLNAGYGEVFQRPSRFLAELPENLREEWEVQPCPTDYRSAVQKPSDEDAEPW